MKQTNDSLGRTVMIAVIAGLLFAGFLALTPRLTAGTQTKADPVGPATVGSETIELDGLVSDPVVAVPGVALDGGPGSEIVTQDWSDIDIPPPDDAPDDDTCVDKIYRDDDYKRECTCVCDEEDASYDVDLDGTLKLTIEVLGPNDGKEMMILSDEDMARWHFIVENAGDEDLWGVYVYLEGAGEAECEASFLSPGDETHCWTEDEVWAGSNVAEAWATAWTTSREVGVEISYHYTVSS